MTSLLPRRPAALLVRVTISALVVLVWWYAAKAQDPSRSDATADWILVKAVSTGLAPFEDVRILGQKLGVPYRSLLDDVAGEPIVAYRTPGGLLLLYPLTLLGWEMAHTLVAAAGLIAFLWMLLVLTPKYCETPVERLFLPLGLACLSAAFIEATFWGTVSTIIALLVALVAVRPRDWSAGLPLAAATLLKLHPGLLFVPLAVKGARRSLGVGFAAVVMTTAFGVWALGLSLIDTARLLIRGSNVWLEYSANISVAGFLARWSAPAWIFPAVTLLGIVAIWLYARRHPLAQSLALGVVVSIMVNPVSWVAYDVILIPLVIWLWTRSGYPLATFAAVTWLVVQAVASPIADLGAADLARGGIVAVRVLVLIAIAGAPARLWEPTDRLLAAQAGS